MEFRDLKKQYLSLKQEMDKAILDSVASGQYILGSDVQELEQLLADYVGGKHCVACANGTDALILSVMTLSIGEGDAVFAPDFTYFATINSAMLRGASPVLVDIDKRTFNICPDALEVAIQRTISEGKYRPRAIITVDLFGLCADYPQIEEIARKYKLYLIEDAAQGFGGAIEGKRACAYGDIAITSFFPAKPLGCYGDGGAIFTNNDDYARKLRSLRAQGRSPLDKYDNVDLGLNSRLDTLQAAILKVKLKAFADYELQAVNQAAERYTAGLKEHVITPYIPAGYLSSWAQYTIMLRDAAQRSALKAHLESKGIPTMIYYPKGMHQQSAVIDRGYHTGHFPHTEHAVQTCLSLPMHPYLKPEEQAYIINEIITFLGA